MEKYLVTFDNWCVSSTMEFGSRADAIEIAANMAKTKLGGKATYASVTVQDESGKTYFHCDNT